MQICKSGIKIHPAAVCGGFPVTAFRVRAASVKVLKAACSAPCQLQLRAGNAAVAPSKTAISTVSRAMLPILLVLLKNMLFSCFIAPSVAHWQW